MPKLKIAWLTILVGLATIAVSGKIEVKPVQAQSQNNNLPSAPQQIEVKEIRFVGNTVFSDERLRKVLALIEGKKLSLSELFDLRSKVSDYYAEQGYVSTSALIPTQNFDDGIIEIRIVEGSLKAVEIQGLSTFNRDYIDSRLPPVGKALNVNNLRDSLVKPRDNPFIKDLKVDLLEVSPGQNVVNLKIVENFPLQSQFGVTNTFSPSVGKIGSIANIDTTY